MERTKIFRLVRSDYFSFDTRKEMHKATGEHYNLPGHQMADMQIKIKKTFTIQTNNSEKQKKK